MKYCFLLIFLFLSLNSFAQNHTQPHLNLDEAKRIADAAEARAKQDNWNVVIAILDGGGHLILLRKMDGTQIGSVDVAHAKAKSAVYFKRPTKVFEDAVNEGNTRILSLPNAVAVEGGIPIFKDGICVGAIGISGVTSSQDAIIAEAGLKAL
ncbi:GlcG/HbpS family heme-binding protein [Shivajiella indica]|uniref:Heme-binding protein n=1 Tax=Shivajiella indica TaxID=872115 RepID=A0ABW5B783_9BACT